MPKPILACLTPLLFALPANAAQLIDFDGDLIPDAGTALRTEDVNNATQRGFFFDDSAAGQFFDSSYNQAEVSGGALLGPGGDGLMAAEFGVTLDATNNRFNINTNGRTTPGSSGPSTNTVIDAFLVFRKDQFLNGGDALAVAFDSTTTITTNASALGRIQRVAIKQGGQWYLSEASTSSGTLTLTDFDNNSAAGKGWAAINPTASDFNVIDDGPTLTYSALDFTDVEAVAAVLRASRGGSGNFARLNDFTVDGATLIPEPASALLVVAGGALLLGRRSRASA
ncbi:MAG: PEP-CTERM sorting domain-containing protein [Planctomycetota bacterium]